MKYTKSSVVRIVAVNWLLLLRRVTTEPLAEIALQNDDTDSREQPVIHQGPKHFIKIC